MHSKGDKQPDHSTARNQIEDKKKTKIENQGTKIYPVDHESASSLSWNGLLKINIYNLDSEGVISKQVSKFIYGTVLGKCHKAPWH